MNNPSKKLFLKEFLCLPIQSHSNIELSQRNFMSSKRLFNINFMFLAILMILSHVTKAHYAQSSQELFPLTKYSPRLELTLKGGNTRSMGRLGGVIPLVETNRGLLFSNIFGLLDTNNAQEGNIGIGYRHIFNGDYILGGYVFYDYRKSEYNNRFNQITVGGEYLRENIEARANVYLPIGRKKQLVLGTNKPVVENRELFLEEGKLSERILHGFDVEVGGNLPDFKPLSGYITYYHFNAPGVCPVHGVRFRASLKLNEYISLEGEISRDGLIEVPIEELIGKKVVLFGGIKFNYIFGKKKEQLTGLGQKMTQMVIRDVDIVTEQQREFKRNKIFVDTFLANPEQAKEKRYLKQLGLSSDKTPTEDELKRAIRKKRAEVSPDKNLDNIEEATQKSQEIGAIGEWLKEFFSYTDPNKLNLNDNYVPTQDGVNYPSQTAENNALSKEIVLYHQDEIALNEQALKAHTSVSYKSQNNNDYHIVPQAHKLSEIINREIRSYAFLPTSMLQPYFSKEGLTSSIVLDSSIDRRIVRKHSSLMATAPSFKPKTSHTAEVMNIRKDWLINNFFVVEQSVRKNISAILLYPKGKRIEVFLVPHGVGSLAALTTQENDNDLVDIGSVSKELIPIKPYEVSGVPSNLSLEHLDLFAQINKWEVKVLKNPVTGAIEDYKVMALGPRARGGGPASSRVVASQIDDNLALIYSGADLAELELELKDLNQDLQVSLTHGYSDDGITAEGLRQCIEHIQRLIAQKQAVNEQELQAIHQKGKEGRDNLSTNKLLMQLATEKASYLASRTAIDANEDLLSLQRKQENVSSFDFASRIVRDVNSSVTLDCLLGVSKEGFWFGNNMFSRSLLKEAGDEQQELFFVVRRHLCKWIASMLEWKSSNRKIYFVGSPHMRRAYNIALMSLPDTTFAVNYNGGNGFFAHIEWKDENRLYSSLKVAIINELQVAFTRLQTAKKKLLKKTHKDKQRAIKQEIQSINNTIIAVMRVIADGGDDDEIQLLSETTFVS